MSPDVVNMTGLILVFARAVALIIAAIGGVLSIYWGWKLYRDVLLAPPPSPTTAELSHRNGWLVKIESHGPGIFFAVFGMIILFYIIRQEVDISGSRSEVPAVSQTGDASAVDAGFFLAQAGTPRRPPKRCVETCLVTQWRFRGSDGRRLTRERIRVDLAEASRLLDKLDRAGLSLADRAALNDAQDTIGEVIAGAKE